jgi:hypothetical protein
MNTVSERINQKHWLCQSTFDLKWLGHTLMLPQTQLVPSCSLLQCIVLTEFIHYGYLLKGV